MESFQKIKIEGIEYQILDSIQDFRAEDSFIHRKNKLSQHRGNGESRKHVGTYKGDKGQILSDFFDYNKWGLAHKDPEKLNRKTMKSAIKAGAVIQDSSCFFSKSNLLKYMEDARTEYIRQEQLYHHDISTFFDERVEILNNLESDYIFFSIYDLSDNLDAKQNRGYIRSDEPIWSIWRELILPKISYLSILKLIPSDESITQKPLFYFRILLDYQFRSFVHPQALDGYSTVEKIEERKEVKRANRLGAEKYRKEVIEYMPQCPFSKITDERLLIASHIKPYSVCIKENREDQALDFLNGLALTPTYDKLFDQGYITFTNKGDLICGTLLSPYTWNRLNINPSARNRMRIFPENREEYLEFHRKHVFQDNFEDLI